MQRYDLMFKALNQANQGAFVPFVTVGDPTPELSFAIIKTLIDNIKVYYWYTKKIELTQTQIERLIEIDTFNLQNLIDDLNLLLTKKGEEEPYISIEQKNLFFVGLDYYYFILELELHHQYPFYKLWIFNFKNTFVYRNIFKHLHVILSQERLKRLQHI